MGCMFESAEKNAAFVATAVVRIGPVLPQCSQPSGFCIKYDLKDDLLSTPVCHNNSPMHHIRLVDSLGVRSPFAVCCPARNRSYFDRVGGAHAALLCSPGARFAICANRLAHIHTYPDFPKIIYDFENNNAPEQIRYLDLDLKRCI
jgi:hypothetical protein